MTPVEPTNIAQLIWYGFLGSWSLLLVAITMYLSSISKKIDYVQKWRSEESAAINEIQGRCEAFHKVEVKHRLTP